MNAWDLRTGARALAASLVALAVVWLITAASDEGQLTAAARASRTLPLAPLCSAVGAALALGTTRVRSEIRALEALGRSPAASARVAALGAAVPSLVTGLAIATAMSVDVGGFYPRAPHGDTFVRVNGAFVSPTLGVRVTDDGEAEALVGGGAAAAPADDDALPRGARGAAAAATALAGLALALVASRASVRTSPSDRQSRGRMRVRAGAAVLICALTTLVAFQAAAARVAPAVLAIAPAAVLLALEVAAQRSRYRSSSLT